MVGRILLLGAVVGALIAVIGGLFAARRIARPIAEMTRAEKERVSHRGRAFRTLADGLKIVEAVEVEQQ